MGVCGHLKFDRALGGYLISCQHMKRKHGERTVEDSGYRTIVHKGVTYILLTLLMKMDKNVLCLFLLSPMF